MKKSDSIIVLKTDENDARLLGSPVFGGILALGIIGGTYFGGKFLIQYLRKKWGDANYDQPENAAARNIYASLDSFFNQDEKVIASVQSIKDSNIDFQKVQTEYSRIYNSNLLTDMQSKLSAENFAYILKILNKNYTPSQDDKRGDYLLQKEVITSKATKALLIDTTKSFANYPKIVIGANQHLRNIRTTGITYTDSVTVSVPGPVGIPVITTVKVEYVQVRQTVSGKKYYLPKADVLLVTSDEFNEKYYKTGKVTTDAILN